MITAPEFQRSFLHPRYWLTWLGLGVLYVLVLLPYPVIYRLGTRLGRLSMRFLKRRAEIADRNLQLCLSLIHISEPTRQAEISYAVFCLKKKKIKQTQIKKKNTIRKK